MKRFLLLLALVLLGGCALSSREPVDVVDREALSGALWKVEISQWGTVRFTGLLAPRLETEKGILHYVLLDGTGIKLLEARVRPNGKQQIIQVVKMLHKYHLPVFMADSLSRIFLVEPELDRSPVGRLVRFDREQPDELLMRKLARVGPVCLWSVDYSLAPNTKQPAEITYIMPWLGMRLSLVKLDRLSPSLSQR
ncbi:MAG: hypothetical protein OEY01_07895 [Desulfobulbaceae bacterium]|nr:hypothetical protein [Desulfobulbaceae bacterium]HIJ78978.1 hypothetical protein [Deltaproteobacteria bacterium]